MFDILKFIDSKDVREWNRGRVFSPMEQAVLIYHSQLATIDEKLAAWHDLLDAYTEDEFQITSLGTRVRESGTNKQILSNHVAAFETALANRYTPSNSIFEAAYHEYLSLSDKSTEYFSNYEAAYTYLQAIKQEYLDDGEADIRISARISTINLNDPDHEKGTDMFVFDNELQMTAIFTDIEDNEHPMLQFCVPVNLDFKKGDIVRVVGVEPPMFGVVGQDVNTAFFKHYTDYADDTYMSFCIDMYGELYGGGKGFTFDHFSYLNYEICSPDELPDDQKMLILVSDVYLGKLDLGNFLTAYTTDGEDAYSVIYR